MWNDLFSSVNLLEKGLGATWLRNEVISNNIANVDTPGFKASEVEFETLMADAPGIRLCDVLHYVLVDSRHGQYPGGLDVPRIRNLGVEVIDCPLIGYGASPDIDDRFLAPILLSLA